MCLTKTRIDLLIFRKRCNRFWTGSANSSIQEVRVFLEEEAESSLQEEEEEGRREKKRRGGGKRSSSDRSRRSTLCRCDGTRKRRSRRR